jgi:hypothetical protein
VRATASLLLLLCAGCATLTPAQSAGLAEAQQLADEVTAAYGVGRGQVLTGNRSVYDEHSGWITLDRAILATDDGAATEQRLVALTVLLGHATLGHRALTRLPTEPERRIVQQQRRAANRRGVEIMARFRHLSERAAVVQYAAHFIALNQMYPPKLDETWPIGYRLNLFPVHPCEQLRGLWSHFAMPDPPPPCEASTASR